MEFRPCIDIHNGSVKQIVGSSLHDEGSYAVENFVAKQDAAFFAELYKKDGISGRAAGGRRHYAVKCRAVFRGRCEPCDRDLLCVSKRKDTL